MDNMSAANFYDYVLRTFKRTDKETEVYEAITETVLDIASRTSLDERKVEAYTSAGITSGSDYKIDLPDDFGRIVGDIRFTDDNQSWTLIKQSKQEFNDMFPDPDGTQRITGQPTHYTIFDGQILLGPVPDRTDYYYQLDYSTVTEDTITSTTDEVPFTGIYREVVKNGTMSRLYETLEEPNLADRFRGLYEVGIEKMKERDRKNTEAIFTVKQVNC